MSCRYTCEICSKTLSSSGSLHNHRATHHAATNDLLACPHCPKTFKLKQKLSVHVLAHAGRKPFECSECVDGGVGFVHRQSLEAHNIRCHGAGGATECDACGKKFADKSYLNRHVKWHERVRSARERSQKS